MDLKVHLFNCNYCLRVYGGYIYNNELHALFKDVDIITYIKLTMLKWAGPLMEKSRQFSCKEKETEASQGSDGLMNVSNDGIAEPSRLIMTVGEGF